MIVSPLLLACPFIVMITLGMLIFFSSHIGKRKSTMRLFGIFLILRAIIYFTTAGYIYPETSFQVYLHYVYAFSLLLNDPILFFGFLTFVFPFKLILKRCWPFLLPAIILGTLYVITYLSYPEDVQQEIAISHWASNEVAAYLDIWSLQQIIQVILNLLSLFYLIIYAKVLIFDFPKYLRNNYSSKRQLNMRWFIYLGILFIILAIIYHFAPTLESSVLIPIMIVETGFGFLTYFALTNTYKDNADHLESYFSSYLISENKLFFFDILFPKRVLPFYNELSDEELSSQSDKMKALDQKLIHFFKEEKPYLQKELCLEDIARRLNTNRTYVSQLLKKEKNTSFYDFVNAYRIEEAKYRMQKHPAISLKCIAEECGFSSYTTFLKYFEKKELTSPNAWKIKAQAEV